MAETTYKRKNYLINKKFQLKYTISIVAMLLVVMLVSGFGLYMGMWGSIIENFSKFKVSQNLENAKRIADYENARYKKGDYRLERIFREAELLSAQEKDTLKNALQSVNKSLVPKIAILSVFIFFAGIFLSHKIAGPMYRIERSAEAIERGDLRVNFRVRRGDEMRDTAGALEGMVEALHDDIKKMKVETAVLKEKVKEESSRDILARIDSVLSKYKT